MEKYEMLDAIKKHLNITKNIDFARFLGIKPTALSMWYKRNTFDTDLLFKKCEFINPEWLLTGTGEMLKNANILVKNGNILAKSAELDNKEHEKIIPIPFVTPQAVAGFGNSNFAIEEQDVKEYYVIPKFKHRKVDFMIEVYGNSMYPKYNSGDIVAATIINNSHFIQWNKPHVIATNEQGILVKRICQGKNDDNLLLKSDNKDYPPFNVPKTDITGIALVVGVIRLE